jgi:hypothetical protein
MRANWGNIAAPADAPIASLFHSVSSWLRAADAPR